MTMAEQINALPETDYKGGLVVGDSSSETVAPRSFTPQGRMLDMGFMPISKSPSNSSFGFENTFRVLERQVSTNSITETPQIVTTLDLELDAIARLQEFQNETPTKMNCTPSSPVTATKAFVQAKNPLNCDKYLEFLKDFIERNRRKKFEGTKRNSIPSDDSKNTKLSNSFCEFGENPEFVYCITKDCTGRYRMKSKTLLSSPKNEGKLKLKIMVANSHANQECGDLSHVT